MAKDRAIHLFGPPGSGKGTQGKILGQVPGLYHFDSGANLRGLDPDSAIGRELHQYLDHGKLVPDDLVIKLWQDHLEQAAQAGRYRPGEDLLVLDGLARTMEEVHKLDSLIQVIGVYALVVADTEPLKQRIRKRGQRDGRPDDLDEEALEERFRDYHSRTQPILEYYTADLIVHVDALQPPLMILSQIVSDLAHRLSRDQPGLFQ